MPALPANGVASMPVPGNAHATDGAGDCGRATLHSPPPKFFESTDGLAYMRFGEQASCPVAGQLPGRPGRGHLEGAEGLDACSIPVAPHGLA